MTWGSAWCNECCSDTSWVMCPKCVEECVKEEIKKDRKKIAEMVRFRISEAIWYDNAEKVFWQNLADSIEGTDER